jgi:hypothetical protein
MLGDHGTEVDANHHYRKRQGCADYPTASGQGITVWRAINIIYRSVRTVGFYDPILMNRKSFDKLYLHALKETHAMKKLILWVAGTLVCSAAWAAVPDETAVNDAINSLSAAMLAGDEQKLKALTTDTLTYGHSSGRVQDQAAFVDTIASGKTSYKRITLTNSIIRLTGNTATVRDHFSGTIEQAGKVSDTDFDVLQVWRKDGGTWRLIARQGYKY